MINSKFEYLNSKQARMLEIQNVLKDFCFEYLNFDIV
jgi:hypothetical protein